MFRRYEENPILRPLKENPWEALMVYNAGVIYEGGKVHILYRARGVIGGVSRIGYASTKDGFHIDERLPYPVLEPEPGDDLESKGCEDPRITRIGDYFYVCYTAYGKVPGMANRGSIQVGMRKIKVQDALNKKWEWSKPIYPFPRVDNKNAFIFPEKFKGKWVMYHRIPPHIWIAYSEDLINWSDLKIVMSPKEEWEHFKLGSAGPAMKTQEGWLFIYHAVDRNMKYRLGVALIDHENPERIMRRAKRPILEPEEDYEKNGVVPNVVFSCGSVIIDDTIYLYYGGADTVLCVATAKLKDVLNFLKDEG